MVADSQPDKAQTAPDIRHRLNINTDLARRMLTGFIRDQIEKAGQEGATLGYSELVSSNCLI